MYIHRWNCRKFNYIKLLYTDFGQHTITMYNYTSISQLITPTLTYFRFCYVVFMKVCSLVRRDELPYCIRCNQNYCLQRQADINMLYIKHVDYCYGF